MKKTIRFKVPRVKPRIPVPPPNRRHKTKKDYDRKKVKTEDRKRVLKEE